MVYRSLFIYFFLITNFAYSQEYQDILCLDSFNTGQVGPMVEARVEFPKYNSSCKTLENMFVTVQGPVTKRPGTKYIATAKTGTPRLISFEYSTDDVYVIEMGNLYMRFFRNGGQILDANSNPYEIITPYDSNEIWDVKYSQYDNDVYLVDGTDNIQKLTRNSHTDWTIQDVNIYDGPFMTENDTDINIAPNDINGTIVLESNAAIFDSGHIGSIWQINQNRKSPVMKGKLDANESSDSSYYFKGAYSFTTSGIWGATVTLEKSFDSGGSWMSALVPLSGINYDNPAEMENDGATYRVTMSDYISGYCEYTLTIADTLNKGIVLVTEVNDSNTCVATVLTELVDTNATTHWREGYWSDYRGWPKTVCFHQQRLIFGGSENFPQHIWFGGDPAEMFETFEEGSLDTSAFTVALLGQNPITWLMSQDYLLIGTKGSCGKYGEQGQGLTVTSPNYQQQSRVGSSTINAVFSNNIVLYAERNNRKVRNFFYNLQFDKYVAYDLTVLSDDITESGIKDMAFQNRPDPILWCILNNGEIATLTYQMEQEVVGWSKIATDGNFVGVTVIPGSDEDEVWVDVQRTIGGSTATYIEQFQPRNWGTDQNDCWFVDSGLNYSGVAKTTFTGLSHLNGKTVSVYADGIVQPNKTVSGGSIALSNSAREVIVGLPYTTKYESMPVTVVPAKDKPMSKKIMSLDIDFYQTGSCKYGNGPTSVLQTIDFSSPNTLTARYDLYTSINEFKRCLWPYGQKKKQTVYIESSDPMPLTIRSIIIYLTLTPL